MMAECDPGENGSGDKPSPSPSPSPSTSPGHIQPALSDRTGTGAGQAPRGNPGGAVRVSDSTESVLVELDGEGSGEEELLLPGPAGSLSPKSGKEKRARRSRRSSSSDKDTLASPGKNQRDRLWHSECHAITNLLLSLCSNQHAVATLGSGVSFLKRSHCFTTSCAVTTE